MPMIEGRCYIVAEIGINHNGDVLRAIQLIKNAKKAGCDAVKFQKRTVDVVYTPEELDKPRESSYGTTNGDLKRGLELNLYDYRTIDTHCYNENIEWFASPWDEESVDFLMNFACPYIKIASASITDRDLLKYCCNTKRPLMISTGMSDALTIKKAVNFIRENNGEIACIYHCTSTYPSQAWELNMLGIKTLQDMYQCAPVGFSGHDTSPSSGVWAAVLGAASVERHLTISRADWGSDQAASLELHGMKKMVDDIRKWETAKGDGNIVVYESERPIIDKLRRKDTL